MLNENNTYIAKMANILADIVGLSIYSLASFPKLLTSLFDWLVFLAHFLC